METSCSQEDLDHLLIFGYASNIYRDDERAEWIDSGRHLIPLLGDSSVLIDRYDGRGALVDLKACESRGTEPPVLSKDEFELERLCDLERYRDCKDDEDLEEFSKSISLNESVEEPNTRKYAVFQYSYDSSDETNQQQENVQETSTDFPYYPPRGLYLPPDLVLPKTMKSHAVIEKTAKFIVGHGTSMEIILKAKQGSNPMFNFLNFSDELNPYYKYLVMALVSNAYKPVPEDHGPQDESSPTGSAHSDEEEHYLHPSLVANASASSSESKASRIPEYKPTGPSAYSALVSKIQEMDQPVADEEEEAAKFAASVGSDLNSTPESDSSKKMLIPTGETQVIIEKMALYVIKNGPSFECLASTKGDPRFTFLDPSNAYHSYYLSCKERFGTMDAGVVASGGFVPYVKNSTQESTFDGSNPSIPYDPALKCYPQTPVLPPLKPPQPNHANAVNRMATLPPALIEKIEQLRQKTLENRAKELTQQNENIYAALPKTEYGPIVAPSLPEIPQENGAVGIRDEAEIRRKAERKKKAALFLKQMKIQRSSIQSTPIAPDSNEVEIVAEIQKTKSEGPPNESDDEVKVIEKISPLRENQTERLVNSSDSEVGVVKESRKRKSYSKKRSKYSSSCSSYSSSEEEERESYRSSSRKRKSSKRKKRKKRERSKSRPSSEKSKRKSKYADY